MQTTRLHESFEASNSSLACSHGELSLFKMPPVGETHAFSAIFGFLGHNFGSRHARRSNKSSIDADDHLVFKKILNHKNGSLD